MPLLAVLAATLSACGAARRPGGSASRNIITSDDIERTRAQTAFEAVSRLQPHWLGSRGPVSMTDPTPTEVSVYLNGVEVREGVAYLRNLDVINVLEMRYYEPGEASARFGMGHPRGVIVVKVKAP